MPESPKRPDTAVTREFFASALYVAIVLLAVLVAIPAARVQERFHMAGLMVGTAIGLTLAHWFAFRLAAGMTDEAGIVSKDAAAEGGAQVAGGMAVAVIAAIPYLLTSGNAAWRLSMLVLAALPALAGFFIGRLRHWGMLRSLLAASVMLVVAAVIVFVKMSISH